MEFKQYHKNLNTLHIGCEKPRAYFIPYPTRESALLGDRNSSKYFKNLSGKWNFNFYDSFEDIPDNFLEIPFKNKIAVPKCWQTEFGKGYDVPLYSNLCYPFPLDPPYVPQENPAGHYNRTFSLKKKDGKKYYINFEGVSSCFYLFINGKFVGYSQVSHSTSELDITEYTYDGVNTIDVIVVKWCDGTYLEDQDFFRLSGIFREVYVLEREEKHLVDIFVKPQVSANLEFAMISAEVTGKADYSFELISPEGKTVAESTGSLEMFIENPVLWNAENPRQYTLLIKAGKEYIPLKLALKKLEFIGNVAYFNNKPIKLFGVNRHDNNPETGYYCSTEDMIRDLCLMKQANVNTIRTSHYPNDPRFLELCQEYGFMIVDEADIETHGMGYEGPYDWDWMRWSKLSTDDEWEASYVDRAERLFERDKNFGCVIMWSLGNESGCGKNHRTMRNYIKSRDPEAKVHYENAHLEFKAVPPGECFSDISDVESRMYSSLDYTEQYAKYPQSKKPFYWCEFSCSMSTGDVHAHCDLIRKYPAMFGGCFWEFSDHAIKVGPDSYRYGGDFGDYPNDYTCCIDGMVFADRTLRPGYADVKKAFQEFEITYADGKISVFNRRYFEKLDDVYIDWVLEKDGEKIKSGSIKKPDVLPRESAEYDIGIDIPDGNNVFLTCFVKLRNDTAWAKKGYEVGFDQINLSNGKEKQKPVSSKAPSVMENDRYVFVKAEGTEYTFDKPFGRICSIKKNNKEILSGPICIELWKAPGYNEFGGADHRKKLSLHKVTQQTYLTTLNTFKDNVEIICKIALGGASVVQSVTGTMKYVFTGDGAVKLDFCGEFGKLLNQYSLRLPRFAFKVPMMKEYVNMEYFGKGPVESYAERHKGTRYGLFKTDVDSNFVPYIKPIENGSHFDTKYARVTNKNRKGLEFEAESGFGFNATRFTPYILEETAHNDELVPENSVNVYLDYKMEIRGGRGKYEELEPERKWDFKPFEFCVKIK